MPELPPLGFPLTQGSAAFVIVSNVCSICQVFEGLGTRSTKAHSISTIPSPEEADLVKSFRIFLVAAALAVPTSMAAPASATCHPEKPSTCEAELPPINELPPTAACIEQISFCP
jgi:hypothetical protein